jgi:hypothetical protein
VQNPPKSNEAKSEEESDDGMDDVDEEISVSCEFVSKTEKN